MKKSGNDISDNENRYNVITLYGIIKSKRTLSMTEMKPHKALRYIY